MAGGSEKITSSEYISHHLQNLTFGKHPDGSWGFAHGAEEAASMGGFFIDLQARRQHAYSQYKATLLVALDATFSRQ